jgi:hypothetical protein
MKRLAFVLFLGLMAFTAPVQAQDAEIIAVGNLIADGNSSELSVKFNESLSIAILDEEANYKKAQAQVVVQDFFAQHSPQSFTLIHSGESSEGSKFGTGTLNTLNGSFRVYFLIRKGTDGYKIHDLRFEED